MSRVVNAVRTKRVQLQVKVLRKKRDTVHDSSPLSHATKTEVRTPTGIHTCRLLARGTDSAMSSCLNRYVFSIPSASRHLCEYVRGGGGRDVHCEYVRGGGGRDVHCEYVRGGGGRDVHCEYVRGGGGRDVHCEYVRGGGGRDVHCEYVRGGGGRDVHLPFSWKL